MMIEFTRQTETQSQSVALEELIDQYNLVLYNDDVNTFDHVINCLIRICKHEMMEAEQCTWIVHVNGKCKVRNGSLEELEGMCTQMMNEGLSVKIE
ncbi:MAG: ATP-dependent Clp protease adaptor ClpS [Crocinitomicaceae bacterium]